MTCDLVSTLLFFGFCLRQQQRERYLPFTNLRKERPCTRCIKRNIGHLCHDEPREPPKKLRPESIGGINNDTPTKPSSQPAVNALLNPIGDSNAQNAALNLAQLAQDRGNTSAGLVQPTPVHAPHQVLTANNQPGALHMKSGRREGVLFENTNLLT